MSYTLQIVPVTRVQWQACNIRGHEIVGCLTCR